MAGSIAPSIDPEFPRAANLRRNRHSTLPAAWRKSALVSSAMPLPALVAAFAALVGFAPASAQVLTIDTSGKGPVAATGPVDRQFQQIKPTHVALSNAPMDTRDRLEIIRFMQAEQGFAMRPLPGGHKGLMLEANGKLNPAGEAYLNMVTANGVSVKPGGRVVVTDIRVDHNKLILDLNDGPDAKHRFLSHVSLGTDPYYQAPVVADGGTPGGARVTLAFKDRVPDLTGEQVKALLAPLISFDVKTPVQAYTDTLPKPLKEAILNHQVWVGMNTDMVIFAKGDPQEKYHEMDGQMPIDIWLYGKAPDSVTFVRINGNRVIRVEIARVGEPLQVFTRDVVSPLMSGVSDTALEADNVHVIQEGDVHRNPDTQAPAPPPTLRNPGETLPTDNGQNGEVMKRVHFPKQQPDTPADPYPDGQQGSAQTAPAAGQSTKAGSPPASSSPNSASAPAAGTQSAKPATTTQPVTIGKDPDDQPQ